MCCIVLQCVAVCCRMINECTFRENLSTLSILCVDSVLQQHCTLTVFAVCCSVLQRVAMCCSVLQCVAACCNVLHCVAVCCSVLQRVAACCSMLQCGAVWCSVLQCVAVCELYSQTMYEPTFSENLSIVRFNSTASILKSLVD